MVYVAVPAPLPRGGGLALEVAEAPPVTVVDVVGMVLYCVEPSGPSVVSDDDEPPPLPQPASATAQNTRPTDKERARMGSNPTLPRGENGGTPTGRRPTSGQGIAHCSGRVVGSIGDGRSDCPMSHRSTPAAHDRPSAI